MTKFRFLLAAAGAMMLVAGCTSEHESIQEAKPALEIRRIPITITAKAPTDEVETRLAQVGRDMVTRITVGEDGNSVSSGRETLVASTMMIQFSDTPIECSTLEQVNAQPGQDSLTFAGEVAVGSPETMLGISGAVADQDSHGESPMSTIPYYDSKIDKVRYPTYTVVKAGSSNGKLSGAYVTAVSTSQNFKLNMENYSATIKLENANALVGVTLQFIDADSIPLANKEVTDLLLRADGTIVHPTTGEKIKGIAYEAQVEELAGFVEHGISMTGEMFLRPTQTSGTLGLQVRISSLCPKPTRAASSLVTDGEGKLKVDFSLLGDVEMPAFSIEGTVDGKLYSAVMSTVNKTPGRGKCYDFGEKKMLPYKILNIENAGELSDALLEAALTDDSTLVVSGTPSAGDLYLIRDWAQKNGKLKTLDLSRTQITEAAPWIMRDVTSLEMAILPDSLTDIRGAAFYGCTALHTVEAPGLKNIHHSSQFIFGAFQGCTALAEIDLPAATFIGEKTFQNCTSLQTANLPEVETIDMRAFKGCTQLKQINCSKVKTVYGNAFQDCAALTSIDLSQATVLSSQMFDGCTALAEITMTANQFDGINPNIFYKFSNIGNATLIVNENGKVNESGWWKYRKTNGSTGEIEVRFFKCVKNMYGVLWGSE